MTYWELVRDHFVGYILFAKKVLREINFLSLEKVNFPPFMIVVCCGVFALEANKTLRVTHPKMRGEVGMCDNKAKEKKKKKTANEYVATAAKQRRQLTVLPPL